MKYLTLPSNSSMERHPDNTMTNFKTHLPETVSLPQGQFEMGLVEISFPYTWGEIFLPFNFFGFSWRDESNTLKTYHVPGGTYANKEAVFTRVQHDLHQFNEVSYIIGPKDNFLKFSRINEFKWEGPSLQDSHRFFRFTGISHLDLEGGGVATLVHLKPPTETRINSLFVYCNLITPQIVGNTTARLLRAVPVTTERGRHQCTVYNRAHYHPLATNSFHTVEIDIRDERGEPIPFNTGGLVSVVLHIRRRISDTL